MSTETLTTPTAAMRTPRELRRARGAATTPAARVRLVIAHVCIYIAALIFVSPIVYAFFSALKPNTEMLSLIHI